MVKILLVKIRLLVFLMPGFLGINAMSQSQSNACEMGKKLIFELNFDQAASNINQIRSSEKKAYLELYKRFVSYMVLNEESYTNYCFKFNKAADVLNQSGDTSFQYVLFLSELHLQRGIIEYQNNNTFKAISNFSKAYGYWKESNQSLSHSPGWFKLAGIFNLLIGNLPQPYNQWVSWFGFAGDVEAGFKYLEKYLALQKIGSGSHYEALLYLGFSYLKFGQDEDRIKSFVQNHTSIDVPVFLQSILLRCANKVRAPYLCTQLITEQTDFAPLLYLQGKYAVQSDNKGTTQKLNVFLNKTKRNEFKADAFRYLSWHYLLKGQTEEFKNYQDSIKFLNEFPTSEDRQAKYEADLDQNPDTILIRARMLFDIGKYENARTYLLNPSHKRVHERNPEYYYRLGRCCQYLGDTIKTLKYFNNCIALPDKNKRYFRPYAAIYAAEILYSNNDTIRGRELLKKAKELNLGEYKYTISQKIKKLENF